MLPPVPKMVKARIDAIEEETLEVKLTHSVVGIDNVCCIVGVEYKQHLKELVMHCMESQL